MDGPPGRQAKPCQQTRSGAGRCTPACRPGSPELSKSYMDMASKLVFTPQTMVWFRWGCTASCGWNVRCVGVRGDAWSVSLI